jgi:hypothetical protein
MARTQINGVQIEDLDIRNAQVATDAGIELSKLEKLPLPVDGTGAMTGNLDVDGNRIINVPNTPSDGQDAVNKNYVDSVAQGLDVKESVRVATTANITLSGEQTIDGVSAVAGDRVLVKNQTDAEDNGIYVVASGAWARSADADSDADVNAGLFTFVEEGTTLADTGWVLTTNNPITVGTTELAFSQFTGAGQVIAGDGLTKSGNTLNVGAGNGITANADNIEVNVDDTTIEISANNLQVKDGGIDENKIASSALGNGLTGGSGTTISIELATNSGLQFNSGALEVKLKSGGGIAKDADGLYLDGASETRVVREVPTGDKNGVNQDYDLANTPTAGSEMVFLNGILQNVGAGNDYTISGATITMLDAPKAKDVILVTYWY